MTEEQRLPYRVQGRWMNGARASLCATPTMALQRLKAYQKARYREVTIIGPDGALTEAELHRLIVKNGKPFQDMAPLVEADLQLSL